MSDERVSIQYSDTDWQCASCVGWLHDTCAALTEPAIGCRCTCQGGELR